MGILADIKATKNLQKIKNGGTASFTVSSIVNHIINLGEAKRTLDYTSASRVFALYGQMRKCNNKMELDYEGFLGVAADILLEFDKIACILLTNAKKMKDK